MTFVSSEEVTNALHSLQRSECDILLLRNTENEIPCKLKEGKDIDILARVSDMSALREVCKRHFKKVSHPLSSDIRLYGVNRFDFYTSRSAKFYIDISYEVVCKSLDKGQWIPLHKKIQSDIWNTKKMSEISGVKVWRPSIEIQLVLIVVRCIFDKGEFTEWHREEISRLLCLSDKKTLLSYFDLIFYSFSKPLYCYLKSGKFNNLITNYIMFSRY